MTRTRSFTLAFISFLGLSPSLAINRPNMNYPNDGLVRALTSLRQGPWNGWEDGTLVVRRYLDGEGLSDGEFYYPQPDLTYVVARKDCELVRTQVVDGRRIAQTLEISNDSEFESFQFPSVSTPVSLKIDGNDVPSVMHVAKTCETPGGCHSTTRWAVSGQSSIVVRREHSNGDWWAVTSAHVPKLIGDGIYECIELKAHVTMANGYVESTKYVSPRVPGHLVEEINRFYKLDGPAKTPALSMITHEKTVKFQLPGVAKR